MATANIDELVETLSKLSVLDIAKLKAALEEKWGVKAAAMPAAVMQAAAAPVQEGAAPAQEVTDFKVILEEAPADKKIAIIKVVREITGLGLKEAKEVVEGVPKVLKETTPKAEAEEMKKKIEAAGGKISLQGL